MTKADKPQFRASRPGYSRTSSEKNSRAVFGCGIDVRAGILFRLAKEHFFYPATKPLFKKLEELSQRSGVSRGQAFEDWLTAMICTLAAETMEGDYLAMVDRHTKGKMGERGVDLMARMFGELVEVISCEDADVLGDLFQGAVTYGEAGQYFSPTSVAQLLATITIDPDARPARDQPIYVHDPLCGRPHNGSSVAAMVMWRSAVYVGRRLSIV